MIGAAVIGTGRRDKNHARVHEEMHQDGLVDAVQISDQNRARVPWSQTTTWAYRVLQSETKIMEAY
jgi:hypothetical protein